MEQNSEIRQATNAWLSYMQIFRTAEKHMLDEYKRKFKKHEPITWDDFERIDSNIRAMMKKAVDEKEMSGNEIERTTTPQYDCGEHEESIG